MHQMTVRGLGAESADSIRRLARQERISLNQAVLRLLRRGAGSSVAGRAGERMTWIGVDTMMPFERERCRYERKSILTTACI